MSDFIFSLPSPHCYCSRNCHSLEMLLWIQIYFDLNERNDARLWRTLYFCYIMILTYICSAWVRGGPRALSMEEECPDWWRWGRRINTDGAPVSDKWLDASPEAHGVRARCPSHPTAYGGSFHGRDPQDVDGWAQLHPGTGSGVPWTATGTSITLMSEVVHLIMKKLITLNVKPLSLQNRYFYKIFKNHVL
jgi:hypothetical protein